MENLNSSHVSKSCMNKHWKQNLYEMRANNTLCDGTITLDDDVVLNVHRPILCACSDYFKAAFNSKLNGSRSNIRISGIRTYIMNKIVDYAYLRRCDLTENNVYEILVIADYLAVQSLLKECITFLSDTLNTRNCVQIMRFAFARNLNDNLFPQSRHYLLRNFEEVARTSDEIFEIPMEHLYDILSDDFLNITDESIAWECIVGWIKYDQEERLKYVTKLLHSVRLGILHTEISTPSIAIPRIPQDIILVTGGWSISQPVAKLQSFDSRADRWVILPKEDPNGPASYHGTAVIGYKVYIIGGFNGETYFNTCHVYDTFNKTWQEISPMHSRRCYVSVVELGGFIYAMGGFNGQIRLSTVERYDPGQNQWTLIESMNSIRSDAHACTLNNRIYIAGGFTGNVCLKAAECYDPNTSEWTTIAEMSIRRSGVATIGFQGYFYAMGGFNGAVRLKSCERYDPANNEWTNILDMSNQRSNFGIEVLDDMIFVIGGYDGVHTLPYCECLDIAENQWYEAMELNFNLSGLKAVVVKGLPNVTDYIYQNRENVIEERRKRMISAEH